MSRKVMSAGSIALAFLALSALASGQVIIENLDRDDSLQTIKDMGAQDATTHDASADAGLRIERGTGWGEKDEAPAGPSLRDAVVQTVSQRVNDCVQTAEEPDEAELVFRYQVAHTNRDVTINLVGLTSNPEIHIGRFELRAAEIGGGKILSVEPAARRFRSCLQSIVLEVETSAPETRIYCLAGEARHSAAGLTFESMRWSEMPCKGE